ncbi:Hypothetical predicted protein [Olea europaea subsp. europaea]|uniref:Thioredoxin-like fold domain-containing protein n=1 Tax=Olea europaea subsp. europaea TaxID=158383 RepID=A0A8S0USE4_OLEEU|nr:Hypothetical predicted protein [Olea europaea subsp. europaea]
MGFKNTLRFLAFLCFRICFFVSIDAQVPIPPKLDGFWYENRPSEADSIFIEAFFDPVCPDSRDSWPGLKQALHHYGSRVTLLVHTFPLPYHDNAFVSSRALHIVNKLNSSATYDLLEAFFQHQFFTSSMWFRHGYFFAFFCGYFAFSCFGWLSLASGI